MVCVLFFEKRTGQLLLFLETLRCTLLAVIKAPSIGRSFIVPRRLHLEVAGVKGLQRMVGGDGLDTRARFTRRKLKALVNGVQKLGNGTSGFLLFVVLLVAPV